MESSSRLTSSAGDSPVRTSRSRTGTGRASTVIYRGYGEKCSGLFAHFDRDSSSWKTSQGSLAFASGKFLRNLAALGFDAEWNCIPASLAVLPQRRSRLFVVAYHPGERMEGVTIRSIQRVPKVQGFEDVRRLEDLRRRSDLPPSLFRGTDDGIPDWVDRLRCLGNAVVPQISEGIGRAIMELAA